MRIEQGVSSKIQRIKALKWIFLEDGFLIGRGEEIFQEELPRRRFSEGKGKRDFFRMKVHVDDLPKMDFAIAE